jgi:hypothetical protein
LGIAEMKIGEQFPPLAHLILVAHLLAGSASSECPVIEEQVKRTVVVKSGDTILVFILPRIISPKNQYGFSGFFGSC